MQSLTRPYRPNRVVLALCLNGVVLVLILVALATRDSRGFGGSAAFGQIMPSMPSSGGGGVSGGMVVMPAQLSPNTWGCYLMDPQNQTLTVYQFSPGEHQLRLAAARDIQYDRKLKFYNTTPPPSDVEKLNERAEEPSRAKPTTDRSPEAIPQ